MDDDGWLEVSTPCPWCGQRDVLQAKWCLRAKGLGTYSISGAQPKVVATSEWRVRCTVEDCGWTGTGEPKGGA